MFRKSRSNFCLFSTIYFVISGKDFSRRKSIDLHRIASTFPQSLVSRNFDVTFDGSQRLNETLPRLKATSSQHSGRGGPKINQMFTVSQFFFCTVSCIGPFLIKVVFSNIRSRVVRTIVLRTYPFLETGCSFVGKTFRKVVLEI